jgi:hypothetical protein
MTKQTTSPTSHSRLPAICGKANEAAGASRGRKLTKEKQRVTRCEEKVAGAASSSANEKPATKQDELASLLLRDEGATIAAVTEATSWLPHTVRAAHTGLKKNGIPLSWAEQEQLLLT